VFSRKYTPRRLAQAYERACNVACSIVTVHRLSPNPLITRGRDVQVCLLNTERTGQVSLRCLLLLISLVVRDLALPSLLCLRDVLDTCVYSLVLFIFVREYADSYQHPWQGISNKLRHCVPMSSLFWRGSVTMYL